MSKTVESLWLEYLAAHPDVAATSPTFSAWHFCDNQADADELAELVLAGVKRATAGALWSYEAEGEPLPQVGDLSIITNWRGDARCIIRATTVEVVPFDQVDADFAAAEGEGDGSLEYWRTVHRAAFGRELEALGRRVEPDMPVVCERFEVVFR